MTELHRHSMQTSDTEDHPKWPESQTLFLLTCYDVWSATPPRHCAAISGIGRTA